MPPTANLWVFGVQSNFVSEGKTVKIFSAHQERHLMMAGFFSEWEGGATIESKLSANQEMGNSEVGNIARLAAKL
ncbi:MAG: hypothetical protein DFNUSKGM_003066 [Candidatus Fervidibacter sacchari]